jgi:hypothetical protein
MLVCIYVGCSPVNFAKDEEAHKCQDSGISCISSNGKDYFDITKKVDGGLVDILIVNDNSASMSFEQSQLSARLAGFIQNLEAQQADYRIAVTTTDISSGINPPRTVNKNGALQDGKLIQFSNGSYYLTNASGTLAQKNAWFKEVIERRETLDCETFIRNNYGKAGYESAYAANCPSGDERGIYAANLVVKNNPNSFIRANAHLAVIVLADEDERSQLYWYNQQSPGSYPGYDLESLDQPQTLASNLRAAFGGAKVLSVHSIITTATTYNVGGVTKTCKDIQGSQIVVNGMSVVSGSYGNLYKQASDMTQGVIGDICSGDYTTQLGQISTNILNRVNSVSLACSAPADLVVTITGQPGVTYSVSGREVKFSAKLNAGTSVRVVYSCTTL